MNKDKYLEKYINDINQLEGKKKLKYWDLKHKDLFSDKQKHTIKFGDVDLDKYCLNNRYYSKYVKKQDNLYSDYWDSVHKEDKSPNIKKDEWYQGVNKRFNRGDLVQATTAHPGSVDYQGQLLGGIVICTDAQGPSWGEWSRPFYKVLWPNGLVEDCPDDWLDICSS